MIKQVHKLKDIRSEVLEAMDTIADPVRGTMSPKGRDVIFEDQEHALFVTNDGVTIAKSIFVKDPIKNAIIQMVKAASMKTNSEAGDGTSTSLLLMWVLMHEAFRLLDAGWNEKDLQRELYAFRDKTVAALKKGAIKIEGDEDIRRIAQVSSNNDPEIADNVVKVMKTAGLDGMVFIEGNNSLETELIEELGFQTDGGILVPELANRGRYAAQYEDVPVLITDKRIYYPEEAESILSAVIDAGYKNVVVVARDFIGSSINTFLANHGKNINVLLIKDTRVTETDRDSIYDLASYLGGEVISEKNGRLVDEITIDDFVIAKKVWADPVKALFTSENPNNREVQKTIKSLRAELKKDKENDYLRKRLASLTNGTVTIRVGGATPVEVKERIYRYEDAISAARAAMKDGYLAGGGVALFNTFNEKDYPAELVPMYRKFTSANIRQIAENCGEHPETILRNVATATTKNAGYNAVTGQIEDLVAAGVIDPYKVTEMAVINSISVAASIIGSGYLIIEEQDESKD